MPYMVYIIYIIVLFGGLHCVVGIWSEPIDGTGSNCPVNWDDTNRIGHSSDGFAAPEMSACQYSLEHTMSPSV